MLAHVKMPHIDAQVEITGKGAEEIMSALKKMFHVETEEYISATSTDWYKKSKAEWTPGTEVRVQRQKHGWTQEELGKKLGVTKQVISDMENNRRSITIQKAKTFGEVFERDYKKFL